MDSLCDYPFSIRSCFFVKPSLLSWTNLKSDFNKIHHHKIMNRKAKCTWCINPNIFANKDGFVVSGLMFFPMEWDEADWKSRLFSAFICELSPTPKIDRKFSPRFFDCSCWCCIYMKKVCDLCVVGSWVACYREEQTRMEKRWHETKNW